MKARANILISDKIDFSTKNITGNKEGYYVDDRWISSPRRYNNPSSICT